MPRRQRDIRKVEVQHDPNGLYYTYKPSPNKLLQRRWDHDKYHKHRTKVDIASHTLDTKAPRAHVHLKVNLKKLEEEKRIKARRERENRYHQTRMDSIKTKAPIVDHIKKDYVKKSLIKETKEKELVRIAAENKAMYKRLNKRQANYANDTIQEEYKTNRDYMTNCANFHHDWHTEQEPYHDRKEKQYISNKKIKQQVQASTEGSPVRKSVSPTNSPDSKTRSRMNTPDRKTGSPKN